MYYIWLYFFLLLSLLFLIIPTHIFALENPLAKPNNKFGMHILFPSEVADASKVINARGGDWGYILIPLQTIDKDRVKWQRFLDDCRTNHVIPIIRLATQPDTANPHIWRKPEEEDIRQFAIFLNRLSWPTENRYVIMFNEVNRNDEWGGKANPAEYTAILSKAIQVFKQINSNFFIISAGMDNAAANSNTAINQYTFFDHMQEAQPDIFGLIDGFGSHAYPNPGFASAPDVVSPMSISSFTFEKEQIQRYSQKKLPIFITETGWSYNYNSETTIADYYKTAFDTVWNNPDIVTVIPFLFRATGKPFNQFSFFTNDGKPRQAYITFTEYPKIAGKPAIITPTATPIPMQMFAKKSPEQYILSTKTASYLTPLEVVKTWLKRL